MRLLPRTTTGTWLLAGAAWLGLSAAAWWLMPPRPRAVADLPGQNWVLAVGPGGRTVVLSGVGKSEQDRVPVRVWDTIAGTVRTVVADKPVMANCDLSPDGRWLAVGVGPADRDGRVRRVRIIDLDTGEEDELVGPPGAAKWYAFAQFSPDGRWLAVAETDREYRVGENRPGVRLWDVAGRRPGVLLSAVCYVAFALDGRRLAAVLEPLSEAGEVAILDCDTGREVARVRRPKQSIVQAVTPDGSSVILGVWTGSPREEFPDRFVCLDVADGHERWAVAGVVRLLPTIGGRQILVRRLDPAGGPTVTVMLDADDGREVSRVPLDPGDSLVGVRSDERTLLIHSPRPGRLDAARTWLAGQGLRWLEPGDDPTHVVDAATGRRLFTVQSEVVNYSPDGRSLAVVDPAGTVALWDLPPHKSLAWFIATVGLLAVVVFGPAWRRTRRLRYERRGSFPPSALPAGTSPADRPDSGATP